MVKLDFVHLCLPSSETIQNTVEVYLYEDANSVL